MRRHGQEARVHELPPRYALPWHRRRARPNTLLQARPPASRAVNPYATDMTSDALFRRAVDADYEVLVVPMTFGKARLCYGLQGSPCYERSFCYEVPARAIEAAMVWDGTGDPLVGWHREPMTGRRRPGGDPTKEEQYW